MAALHTYIGSGNYGHVTALRVAAANRSVAIKWIAYEDGAADEDGSGVLYHEALDEYFAAVLLSACNVPAFPTIYGAWRVPALPLPVRALVPAAELAEEAEETAPPRGYLVVASTYGNLGDLHSRTRRGLSYCATDAAAILFDLAWAFMVAHARAGWRYHGDLQARNIVFRARAHPETYVLRDGRRKVLGAWKHFCPLRPLVVDCGFASYVDLSDALREPHDEVRRLAYHYAPELYFSRAHARGGASDVWQLGVIALTLFGRRRRKFSAATGPPDEARDRQLLHDAYAKTIDLIDMPTTWIDTIARRAGVTAAVGDPGADESDGTGTTYLLARQVDMRRRFVAFLADRATLPPALAAALTEAGERDNAHKFARFVNVALLQNALGNGWCPPTDVAQVAGFSDSAFYTLLQEIDVQAFVQEHILNPDLLLATYVDWVLAGVPSDVCALLRRMLNWDPAARPTCAELVQDAVFARLLGRPDASDDLLHTHNVRDRTHVLGALGLQCASADLRAATHDDWAALEREIADAVCDTVLGQ